MAGRVPQVWGDSLATVGMVLNQEGKAPQPGDPMSPGVSPGTKHFIVNYQPYTSLTEWEKLKSNLAREGLPCKRSEMRDYLAVENSPQMVQALPAEIPPYSASPSSYSSDGNRSCRLSGQSSCSSARGSQDAFKAAAGSSGLRQLPTLRENSLTDGEPPTSSAAPVMLQAASVQGNERSAQVAGRLVMQRSPRTEVVGDYPDPGYDEAGMKVSRIKANMLKSPRYGRDTEKRTRVADKDKAQYGTGSQMRPAREMNRSSKKRLNELLKLPTMRIEAGEKHPSHSYDLIPTANLRVV